MQDFAEIVNSTRLNYFQLAGKSILITGGNGLIASYIIRYLAYINKHFLPKPIKIYALVRDVSQAVVKFSDLMKTDYFELIVQDVSYEIHGIYPEYIFHLASQASPTWFKKDPIGVIDANTLGTKNMLLLAKQANSKILFISSGEVYGQTCVYPTAESDYGYIDLQDSRSCYAEGKRLAEVLCVCATKQWGVDAKIVRPFHSYGPGMNLENDSRVFADFVRNIVNNENIIMYSDGSAIRSFLYLQDLVEGFFTVLFHGVTSEAYNVAGNAGVSIMELAEMLVGLYPEKNLKVIKRLAVNHEYLPSKITRNYANVSKLEALGWNQKVSLEDGFRRTIKSYLEGK